MLLLVTEMNELVLNPLAIYVSVMYTILNDNVLL